MNKEELLSEGYLVAYLTGELDDAQQKEVASFIANDREVSEEFYTLQKTFELLSFHYAIPAGLPVKRQVMENPVVMGFHAKDKGYGKGLKLLMAASVLITLVSVIAAFYYWNAWQSTSDRLAQLTARNLELAENYYQVNQALTQIRRDLDILVSPEFSRIILAGTENSPDASAVIYWNPGDEEVFLNSTNLAPLPPDRQYQLWALIDGKPVDAGVFDVVAGTFQLMKGIAEADAFAVTVEPAGGSKTPTLSTMQVFGKIS